MKILKSEKKFIIFGIFTIGFLFVLVNLLLPNSYALNGFGELSLTCDKIIGVYGEEINCTIKGTVAKNSEVSAISSQIDLSDNLEFVSFTPGYGWEGDGDDGNIQLYTENNKSSEFIIGNLVLSVNEGIVNTNETINLIDNSFYDVNFDEQKLPNLSTVVKTPSYSSEVYDLTKNYLLVNTKDIANIISKIETNIK